MVLSSQLNETGRKSQTIGSIARRLRWSLIGWPAVGIFWLIVTRAFHPTWALAILVTRSLVSACARASRVNHLALVPRCFRAGRCGIYAAALLGAVAILAALALAVIRTSYFTLPGLDPNGISIDFTIDFPGPLLFRVAAAVSIVWFAGRVAGDRRDGSPPATEFNTSQSQISLPTGSYPSLAWLQTM